MQVDGTTGGTGTPTAAEASALANTFGTSDSDMLYHFFSAEVWTGDAHACIEANQAQHHPTWAREASFSWQRMDGKLQTCVYRIYTYTVCIYYTPAYIHID